MSNLINGIFKIEPYAIGDYSVIARDTTIDGLYSDTQSNDILIFYINQDWDEEHEFMKCADTINECIDMFNSGKNLMEIDDFLLNDGRCYQEDREIIMEGFCNYVELFEKMPNTI